MLRHVPVDLRHFRSFVVIAEEGHVGRRAPSCSGGRGALEAAEVRP
jgi:hypothetical protein